ncbi:MAG TPA: type II secretion system F family protein, partial [Polyangiaceae bacterium]|nr:type II secretion system F family protein [Polyangiaceae bacterium]
MPGFEYKGLEVASGKAVKGYRDADSPKALRALLRREGILLTLATPEAERHERAKRDIQLLGFLYRPSASDVAVLTRQLATLVRAGVPLVESISALVDQVEKESLVRILTDVAENLKEGKAFADSLGMHPKVFPPLYVNMVAAGEASGTLEAVLERLADFMEGQARLKGKLISALAYPVLMTLIATVLVGALMVGVVPKVTTMFENMQQELPWYTALLIFVSDTLAAYWWLVFGTIGLAIYLFRRWKRTPAGRLIWDRFMLRVPIFGRLNLLVAVARFSRTLSTLLASGVALLPAMDIVKSVLENVQLETVVKTAIGSIREGESIADPLRRSGYFPPMVTHMI